jgi:hypothetical protein
MIPYPTNFPAPDVSLSANAETPTVRTDLENGLIEQFGRFATGRETYNVSWQLSEDELAAFEEWFAETLIGGVLIFGLDLPKDGAYETQPVRFVGGSYEASHKNALWWNVTARIERMIVAIAPSNRTLPIPQWLRLAVDPTASQNLTLAHRNALLTVRPDDGSTTTLRIYPPTDETQYIYFGIQNLGDGETLITSEDVDPLPPEAVPSWPGTLPNLNRAFRVGAERKASRLDMESGHARQWAGLETTVKGYNVEFDFTLAQLQTFQDFFYTTLKSGSLPFWLTLPVDGQFIPVIVRFVGGKYSESYTFHDTFRVSASLDRITAQTVLPSAERPYPEYYGPRVNVTANRKMLDAEGKFFIVNPDAGQTISLHIYATTPEFGLLITGLGNVLITRGPFIVDLGDVGTDEAGGIFGKPTFELKDTILNIGSVGNDYAESTFAKPTLELISVVEDVGNIGTDYAGGVFGNASFEILTVLEDVGTLATDNAGGVFLKPSFELVIP